MERRNKSERLIIEASMDKETWHIIYSEPSTPTPPPVCLNIEQWKYIRFSVAERAKDCEKPINRERAIDKE